MECFRVNSRLICIRNVFLPISRAELVESSFDDLGIAFVEHPPTIVRIEWIAICFAFGVGFPRGSICYVLGECIHPMAHRERFSCLTVLQYLVGFTRNNCHGHTNPRLRQSTDDEATTVKVTNVELDMMRLETLEVGSNEMRNLGH